MKLFFLLILISLTFTQTNLGQTTKISGHFQIPQDTSTSLTFRVVDNLGFREEPDDHTVKLNNGHFSFSLELSNLTTIAIMNPNWPDGNIINILVDPGDSVYVTRTKISPNSYSIIEGLLGSSFTGRGSEKSKFLQKYYRSRYFSNRQLPSNKDLGKVVDFTKNNLNLIDSVLSCDKILSSIDKSKLKTRLVYSEMEFVTAILRNRKIDSVFLQAFDFVKTEILPLIGPHAEVMGEQPAILREWVDIQYLIDMQNTEVVYKFNRWDDNGNTLRYFNEILEFYHRYPKLKEVVVSGYLYNFMMLNGYTESVNKLVARYLSFGDSKNSRYSAVKEKLEIVRNNLKPGVPFYNFSLPDPSGKFINLDDFRGKVVVLDFFFEGCAPCKAIIPVLQELERKFEGRKIAFISISIDETKVQWERSRGIYSSPSATQLFTEGKAQKHPMVKFAGFSSVPALFILDKEGRFLTRSLDPRTEKGKFELFALVESQLAQKSK